MPDNPGRTPFALADPAFAELAAGRPSASTLATVRRSQLSRHLLLLSEIARAAPGPGYAALAAAELRDPAAVRRRLADPLVGAWAAGCLAALHRGEPAPAAGIAHLTALAAGPPSTGHRLTADEAGLIIDVRLEDTDPLRERLGLTPAGRLAEADLARWRRLFADAWRLLVTRHRAAAEVVAAVVTVIVPVVPDPAARGISATSADAFGAVAMSPPADATSLAVALIHETQHSLLNAVQHLFDLHERPADGGYSPWRDDPRPAAGILHGAYAYLAVAGFWRRQWHADPGDGLAAFEFVRWRDAVAAAARELLAGDGLTAAGRRFTEALLAEVEPWLNEPAAGLTRRVAGGDVVRWARGANRDHYLRWRLRNQAVDPADVQTLADAWRRGRPPPAGAIRSRLVPAPQRALESSARLDLAHAWVGGEQPGGRASAADIAYLGGDGGAAAVAYENMILIGSCDAAAWAGIALVRGWERVEVLAAVHRALRPEVVDVTALARWMSPALA